MDTPAATDSLLFERFRFDRCGRGLARLDDGGVYQQVAIGSRALEVLAVLLNRRGELVPKTELMRAVWPGTTVAEHNLTVQISSLRRVLDEGRSGTSCIQTVAGRGYRFLGTVDRIHPVTGLSRDDEAVGWPPPSDADAPAPKVSVPDAGPVNIPRLAQRRGKWAGFAALAVLVLAIGLGSAWLLTDRHQSVIDAAEGAATSAIANATAPRLSLVVLPFQDMDDDPTNDYLADAITDDLTTDLSQIAGAFVIARESAYTYKGKTTDVRQIGRELGVRYVLEGSVRRIGDTLWVNVQLVSAETGAHLWSDRFNEAVSQLAAGHQQIIARMYDTIGVSVMDIEAARSLRERPTNPDAFDLILQARSLRLRQQTPERDKEIMALYERALTLDPSSALAMTGVAYQLIERRSPDGWGSFESLERAGQLLAQARTLEPRSPRVLDVALYWLRTVGRCAEVIETAEHALRIDPNRTRGLTGIYNELAVCRTRRGHAEEELALQAQADELNPRSVFKFSRYRHMGFAAMMLGRDQDAIGYLERSLAINPQASALAWTYRMLAATHARLGHVDDAKRWLAQSVRLWPYITVRGVYPEELGSPVYAQQLRNYQAGLRLAGLRDHADEDTELDVPPDALLRSEMAGQTPSKAPGVKTIRTAELVGFLADAQPLVIDTVSNSWGTSIPGAIGLKFSGLGGSFADGAQDRLRRKMAELTGGNVQKPIVAVGWNSERFEGRNLALRLVALGYTNVYWYRGGREAWEVADLPEAELAPHEW